MADLRVTQFAAKSVPGSTDLVPIIDESGTPVQAKTTVAQLGAVIAPAIANVTGLGTGVGTFLATPTSANLASALTDETGSGANVFGTAPTLSNPVVGTQTASDNSTKAASTAYVTGAITTAISGVNPAIAVQAATTANVSGYTYSNGVAGIGATLTQNSAAVVVIDGYTLLINDRVLFKNQTTGANNGVYFISTLGTGIIPAVFTRALDYDQPSDINNTGAIPVVNGTVNTNTSWLLTSTVNTVGTDALTYVQFSIAPATQATLTGTQTLTNKRISSRTGTTTSSATPTINTNNVDFYSITALATAITSMTTNLSGTPAENDKLWIAITDNGTAQAITWGASFESSTQILPTTTVISARLDIGFTWNTVTSKWRCVATA